MSCYLFMKKILLLRKKWFGDKKLNAALSRIVWNAYENVYFDNPTEVRCKISKDYRKIMLIKKHCKNIIYNVAFVPLMLTLTFSDESLFLSRSYVEKQIREYLAKNTVEYYAFVDYGKKTNRKHYHIICNVPPCNLSNGKHIQLLDPWKFGFHNVKIINSNEAWRYASKSVLYASKNDGEHFRSRKSRKPRLVYHNLPLSYISDPSYSLPVIDPDFF